MVATNLMAPVHGLGVLDMTRVSEPQDHANVLAFLISDLSKEINGAILPVDNGWSTI